jgi:hypothetical protein
VFRLRRNMGLLAVMWPERVSKETCKKFKFDLFGVLKETSTLDH